MKFNTRFNLRKQESKKPEKIYLICRFGGEKLVYPTSFSVLPKNWNTKDGVIRNVIAEPMRDDINTYLANLRLEAKNIFDRASVERIHITKELIKEGLDKWTGKVVENKPKLLQWIKSFIDNSSKRIFPKSGRFISFRTIQKYTCTFNYIKDFEKRERLDLTFDNITIHVIDDFKNYLTVYRNFSINNIAKHIDNFKFFLRNAIEDGYTIEPVIFSPKRLYVAKEVTTSIYLNDSELDKIANVDFSDSDKRLLFEVMENGEKKPLKVKFDTLDRVRDLFLIGCYTGLRVSDYNNLKQYNIKNGHIDIHQYKTGNRVVIPISNQLQAILDKYNGIAPAKISDQKLNMYIKQIGKLAGINESIEKQRTIGGVRKSEIFQKYELMSSHTARRSFATNMVKKGVPTRLIMAITGHKQENVFAKYVKLSPVEFAELMQKEMTKTVK